MFNAIERWDAAKGHWIVMLTAGDTTVEIPLNTFVKLPAIKGIIKDAQDAVSVAAPARAQRRATPRPG